MNQNFRRVHRYIGLLMMLPMLGWVFTGVIFFLKPGYGEAYAPLPVKLYPLMDEFVLSPDGWDEIRLQRTILGDHLLVEGNGEPRHLDPETMQAYRIPSESAVLSLMRDAISIDHDRYGEITGVSGLKAVTSTGVELTLNWDSLTLRQYGRDTGLIDLLYRVHYLQWTPSDRVNQMLGLVGLLLLFCLTVVGFFIWLKGSRIPNHPNRT